MIKGPVLSGLNTSIYPIITLRLTKMSSPKTSTLKASDPSIYWVLLALMIDSVDLILGEKYRLKPLLWLSSRVLYSHSYSAFPIRNLIRNSPSALLQASVVGLGFGAWFASHYSQEPTGCFSRYIRDRSDDHRGDPWPLYGR